MTSQVSLSHYRGTLEHNHHVERQPLSLTQNLVYPTEGKHAALMSTIALGWSHGPLLILECKIALRLDSILLMNRRFKVEAPQLFPSKSIDGFFASSFNQNPLQVPEGLCLLVVDVEIDIEPLFIYLKAIRSIFPTNAGNAESDGKDLLFASFLCVLLNYLPCICTVLYLFFVSNINIPVLWYFLCWIVTETHSHAQSYTITHDLSFQTWSWESLRIHRSHHGAQPPKASRANPPGFWCRSGSHGCMKTQL